MNDKTLYIRNVYVDESTNWLYISGVFSGFIVDTKTIINHINKWMAGYWKINQVDYKEVSLTKDAENKYDEPLRFYGDFEVNDFE